MLSFFTNSIIILAIFFAINTIADDSTNHTNTSAIDIPTQSPSVSLSTTMQKIYESRFGAPTSNINNDTDTDEEEEEGEEEEEEEDEEGNMLHFQQLLHSLACYTGLPWCHSSSFPTANGTNSVAVPPAGISANRQNDVIGVNTVDNLQLVTGGSGFNINDELVDIGNDLINYGIFKVEINVAPPTKHADSDTDIEDLPNIGNAP